MGQVNDVKVKLVILKRKKKRSKKKVLETFFRKRKIVLLKQLKELEPFKDLLGDSFLIQ